jgi:uncharacterized membrane protein
LRGQATRLHLGGSTQQAVADLNHHLGASPMNTLLKLYLIAIPVFFVLDILWLGVVARGFYQDQIGQLLRERVNWVAAVAFYLVFLVGVVVFVVAPAVERQSLQYALVYGALFGLVTYSAYDLTNLAVAKDWPLTVTLVDLAWGTVLTATVSVTTAWIALRLQ